MSTTHKFTVKSAVLDEVYTKNHNRNLCNIRKACYPFKEMGDTTELFAATPSALANILLEDNIPFSYESYDIDKTHAELYEDLVTEYEKRGQKLEDLAAEFIELRTQYGQLSDVHSALKDKYLLLKTFILYNHPEHMDRIKQITKDDSDALPFELTQQHHDLIADLKKLKAEISALKASNTD